MFKYIFIDLQIVFALSVCSLGVAADVVDKPFSTTAREVNGVNIRLDSLPSKSYTHYLQSSRVLQNLNNYTFHIQLSDVFDGTFISLINFESLKDSIKIPEVCSIYNIKLTYPDGEIGWLCKKDINFTTDFYYYDWYGSGVVDVEVSRIDPFDSWKYNGLHGTPALSDSTDADRPLLGPTHRQVPVNTIGAITFTSYKDCSNISTVNTDVDKLTLRPCGNNNTFKCIASDLFCDGDVNCPLTYTKNIDVIFYDEMELNGSCTNGSVWKQEPRYVWTTRTSTYPPSSTYIAIPIGLIAVGIIACIKGCLGPSRNGGRT